MATSEKEKTLQTMFDRFYELFKGKDGKLPLEGVKTWFKQASLTSKASVIKDADIGSSFKNTATDETGITFAELRELVAKLSEDKKMDQDEIIAKLSVISTVQPVQADDDKKIGKGSV